MAEQDRKMSKGDIFVFIDRSEEIRRYGWVEETMDHGVFYGRIYSPDRNTMTSRMILAEDDPFLQVIGNIKGYL